MGGCAVSGSLGCARSISSKVLLGVVLRWVFGYFTVVSIRRGFGAIDLLVGCGVFALFL